MKVPYIPHRLLCLEVSESTVVYGRAAMSPDPSVFSDPEPQRRWKEDLRQGGITRKGRNIRWTSLDMLPHPPADYVFSALNQRSKSLRGSRNGSTGFLDHPSHMSEGEGDQ